MSGDIGDEVVGMLQVIDPSLAWGDGAARAAGRRVRRPWVGSTGGVSRAEHARRFASLPDACTNGRECRSTSGWRASRRRLKRTSFAVAAMSAMSVVPVRVGCSLTRAYDVRPRRMRRRCLPDHALRPVGEQRKDEPDDDHRQHRNSAGTHLPNRSCVLIISTTILAVMADDYPHPLLRAIARSAALIAEKTAERRDVARERDGLIASLAQRYSCRHLGEVGGVSFQHAARLAGAGTPPPQGPRTLERLRQASTRLTALDEALEELIGQRDRQITQAACEYALTTRVIAGAAGISHSQVSLIAKRAMVA